MREFAERFRPEAAENILDVGGYPATWREMTPGWKSLTILNLDPFTMDGDTARALKAEAVVGDACALPYADRSFDIVFSNSVIEHVGTWENQKKFAAEAARVGHRLSVQTPAREFFIEPHYIAPFVHWLPRRLRRRILRNFTVWGWMTRPDGGRIEAILDEIRLLTYDEMQDLFPDCEIIRERFLGVFTKSYTAIRTSP
ncbi:hypothetical protein BH23VER1_BH23VER1_25020 [soil metagenome]